MFASSKQLIIGLVGPCGAGKSTLASAFADFQGVHVVQELPSMVLDSSKDYSDLNMSMIQRGFLHMRLQKKVAPAGNVMVFDRTIDEDCNVFLRLHHELGGLNDKEFLRLEKLAKRIRKRIGVPDVTVVVRAEPGLLKQRISNGARPAWIEESYDRQLALYATFIKGIQGAVLEVDTTFLSPHALRSISEWILKTAPLVLTQMRTCESLEHRLRWEWRKPLQVIKNQQILDIQ